MITAKNVVLIDKSSMYPIHMIIDSTESIVNLFHKYWLEFTQKAEMSKVQDNLLYEVLLRAYTEPQRHYHTLQHIVECLAAFHQVKAYLDDPTAVELAIWFHDVVYNPQAIDNEVQSAELMLKLCQNTFKQSVVEKAYQWIIATQKHQPSQEDDLNYLLDIDLAILGSSEARFLQYEQQIRLEYAWVEQELYQVKRAEVLQHFYLMQPLYQTEYFRAHLEESAKMNLSKSLSSL